MPYRVHGIPYNRNRDTLNPCSYLDVTFRNLCTPYRNAYTVRMSKNPGNIAHLRPEEDTLRVARAKYMHGLLKAERWSIRAAALQIGMNHTVLSTRMNGSTAFLADEIESIAQLLKVDPVDLYRSYLTAGSTPTQPPTDL